MGTSTSNHLISVDSAAAALACKRFGSLKRGTTFGRVSMPRGPFETLCDSDDTTVSGESQDENPSKNIQSIARKKVDKDSTVFIFDLDDTLVPTEWIRSSYSSQKDQGRLPNEVYRSILQELNTRTENRMIPEVVKALKKAKKLCNTVAIVTNARSVRWLGVIEQLFPEIFELLHDENIPIIRSKPSGQEPSILESTAYFMYWMNAKKIKFQELVQQHFMRSADRNAKVDIISIGDNDFEEYAALHLAVESPQSVRFAKVVRCRSGLTPEIFLKQLEDINNAIDLVFSENNPRDLTYIGENVTYRIHGSMYHPPSFFPQAIQGA